MKINKEARALSRQLLRGSFTAGRLDQDRIRALVNGVIEQKPRGYIAALKNFTHLLRLELAKRHAVIESATDLDVVASASLLNELRAKYGADITSEFKTNPDLIGGLRISLGSDVWDGSVKNRLDRLASAL